MADILFLIAGVILLSAGGEILIRGALGAAKKIGISPLLSGLVIVGFGTSSPELAVSVDAALNSNPDIAIGNIVGSNISNILLILGVCAIITPVVVTPTALHRDAVTALGGVILFMILLSGGVITRLEGLFLMAGLAAYLTWAYRSEKVPNSKTAKIHKAEAEEVTAVPVSLPLMVSALVFGLLFLVGGSRVLLTGAVGIAESYGLSEAVIGLTLVAVGTSLPELTITIIAAFRNHAEVAIGNILGSNIFNILGILGISAVIQPLSVSTRILLFDQWVLLAVSAIMLLFLYTGMKLNRVEGVLFLIGYAAYIGLSFSVFG